MNRTERVRAFESSAAAGERASLPRSPSLAAVVTWLAKVAELPWFAYGSILLIQSKLLWGIWDHRDLTNGDTASYFRDASNWASDFNVEAAYSPLYTAAWGSLKWLIPDVYDVSIAHRVIIVLVASVLVLAVLRRLLPAGLAWVLALWWTILPINYDTVYEVHLFAVLPTMAAVLVALTWSGFVARGTVLVFLLVAGLMVRNELLLAAIPWAVLWAGWEIRRRRRGEIEGRPRWERLGNRALPIATAVGVLLGGVVVLGPGGGEGGGNPADLKSRVILCQNYYVGASQRERFPQGFDPNRPLDCQTVMRAEFGDSAPSWTEALRANPEAMADHVLWNAHLIPQGIELMLFNQISSTLHSNPDDVPVTNSVFGAFLGLVAVVAFILTGVVLLWRERRRWWDRWLRERAWGWAVLACLAISAVIVMLTIRPRPSYLFNFSIATLAVVGTSAMVIGSRWPWASRLKAAIPVLALAVLIAVPSHYDAHYVTPQAGQGRPLLRMYDRLQPYKLLLRSRYTRFMAPQFGAEACVYASEGGGCPNAQSFLQAINRATPGTSLPQLIRSNEINLLYVDELVTSNPSIREMLERFERRGWRSIGPPLDSGAPWALLGLPPSASADRL
jgi:hypothetical protein